MTAKERYVAFLTDLEAVPVFAEPWFLDAVCSDGIWDAVLVEEGGEIQAALPYYCPRPGVITMPPLTQVMGPLLRPVDQKYASRLSREKRLMNALIAALPDVKSFSQRFSPQITNWLPFYWAGFQQTTCYTYRFEDLSDLGAIWDGMTTKLRGHIRQSEDAGVRIEERDHIESFLDLVAKSYEKHGRRNPNRRELVRRLYRAAVVQGRGSLHFAIDRDARPHAASLLVWNRWCAYNLAGGGDPALRASGAHNQILWELVKAGREHSRTFDFEGSMVESIESAFRSFGSRQVPYFAITRDRRSPWDRVRGRFAHRARNLLTPPRT
jgi:hypothetical protein